MTHIHKTKLGVVLFLGACLTACGAEGTKPKSDTSQPEVIVQLQGEPKAIGYSDTPLWPDGKWRVHDIDRPRPKAVTPGAQSHQAPSDAIVLFDGSDLSQWESTKGGAPTWLVEDGIIVIPPAPDRKDRVSLRTKDHFGDVQLHIEWRSPSLITTNSQGRGNSGVQFFEQYEVQVLDSYDNPTYADGQAASLYGWKPPLVNAMRPPGQWQSYDIVFEAPKFDADGTLTKPAYVTVLHNGVLVQYREAYIGKSAHKTVAEYTPHAARGPIKLQHHGDAVAFRNIWLRELDFADKP